MKETLQQNLGLQGKAVCLHPDVRDHLLRSAYHIKPLSSLSTSENHKVKVWRHMVHLVLQNGLISLDL